MKKSKLLVLSLLAVSAIGLTSCGEAGPKGEKGDPGISGEKGETGAAGQDGKDGTNGKSVLNGEGAPKDTLGVDGDSYIDYSSFDYYVKENGKWVKKGNIKGEQGDAGEQGPKGETGEKGEKGDTGSQGATGGQGNKGKTAWSNTILPSTHGYVTVDKGSQVVDEKVTFYFHPDAGEEGTEYKLIDLTLNGLNAPAGSVATYLSKVDSKTNSLTVDMVEGGFVVAATFGTDTDKDSLQHYVLGSDGKYYANVNDAYDAGVEKATLQANSDLIKNLDITREFALDLKGHNLYTKSYTINVNGIFNAVNSDKDTDGYIYNETDDTKVITVGAGKSTQIGSDSHKDIASGISTFSNRLERYDNTSSKVSLSIGAKVIVKTASSKEPAISLEDASASITVEEGSKVVNANETATGAKAISVTAGTLNVAGEVESTKGVAVEVKESKDTSSSTNVASVNVQSTATVSGETNAITISGGSVTVEGNVQSSGTAVKVEQTKDTAVTSVKVQSTATVSGTTSAIEVTGGSVTVDGKVESKDGVAVKVSQTSEEETLKTEVKVTTNAEISGTKAVEISSGSVTVDGGTVSGSKNGIEVSGGSVEVKSGKVESTATSTSADSDCAAISIKQGSSSSTEIAVKVTGGSIESDAGSAVKQSTTEGATQTVKIDLEGGSYATNSTEATTKTIDVNTTDSENVKVKEDAISYSVKLVVESGDNTGSIKATKDGKVVTSGNVGDKIIVTLNAGNDYTLKSVYINGVEKTLKEGETSIEHTMTNKGLTVKAKFVSSRLYNSVKGTNGEYETVDEAFKAGETSVKLAKDSEIQSEIAIEDTKSFSIDLNGHNLKAINKKESIKVNSGGTLEVKNSSDTKGTFEEAVPYFGPIVLRNTNSEKTSDVTVSKNVCLKGWSGIFVSYGPDELKNKEMKANINLNGCEIQGVADSTGDRGHGIYVNGTCDYEGDNLKIDLNGVTINTPGDGMYLAGYANTTIKGNSSITGGDLGIEIRAGKLTIDDGTFEATTKDFSSVKNGNGTTTTGAGLAIVQHTTKKPIEVTINCGTFKGVKGLFAADTQGNKDSEHVKITLNGGTFTSTEEGGDAIDIRDGISCKATDAKLLGDIYFAGGEGTEEHPYLVSTTDQFDNINAEVFEGKSLHYKLTKDIDLRKYTSPKALVPGIVFDLENDTLDLGNHTITSNNFGVVYDGSNATIKNGSFIADNNGSYALYFGNEYYWKDDKKDYAENVILENLNCTGGINIYTAKVTIRGSKVNQSKNRVEGTNYYAVWGDEYSEVTIEDGTYSSTATLGLAVINNSDNNSKITIKGGTYIGNDKVEIISSSKGGVIVCENGIFNQDVSEYVADGYECVKNPDGSGTWIVRKSSTNKD